LFPVLVGVCIGRAQYAARFQEQSASVTNGGVDPEQAISVFREIESKIRQTSQVPLVLPLYLPYFDKANPIYAVLRSANRSSYDVLLANAIPCEGANWCLYGSVRGADAPFDHTFNDLSPKARSVRLHHGITARFIESECATYCTQAYIEWSEKGFYYSIGLKAGTLDQLIKIANSAIDAGK